MLLAANPPDPPRCPPNNPAECRLLMLNQRSLSHPVCPSRQCRSTTLSVGMPVPGRSELAAAGLALPPSGRFWRPSSLSNPVIQLSAAHPPKAQSRPSHILSAAVATPIKGKTTAQHRQIASQPQRPEASHRGAWSARPLVVSRFHGRQPYHNRPDRTRPLSPGRSAPRACGPRSRVSITHPSKARITDPRLLSLLTAHVTQTSCGRGPSLQKSDWG